jgi:hypothetical protein
MPLSASNFKMILKIQEAKLSALEKSLSEKHKEYMEACGKLEERESIIRKLNAQSNNLNHYTNSICQSYSVLSLLQVETSRFWNSYDLEMHEYYLNQEKTEVSDKKIQHDEIKKVWLKQKLKADKFEAMYKQEMTKNINIKSEREEESIHDNQAIKGNFCYE